MNLNLSDWDWLNAALGVLFLYRGIRDLYNGTGTGWSSEDEKKHFRKFYGIASILCGALYLVNIFLPEGAVLRVTVILVERQIEERVFALKIPNAGDEPDNGQHKIKQSGNRNERLHEMNLPSFSTVYHRKVQKQRTVFNLPA